MRPQLIVTISPDVKEALCVRAERSGTPISHVTDDLLRVALGLPEIPEVDSRPKKAA